MKAQIKVQTHEALHAYLPFLLAVKTKQPQRTIFVVRRHKYRASFYIYKIFRVKNTNLSTLISNFTPKDIHYTNYVQPPFIVDPQIDFISGSLAVNGAAKAMDALADYLYKRDELYQYKIVTNDWHPLNHCSFQRNGGSWPVHCVQYSIGAAIYPKLLEPLFNINSTTKVLTKGNNPRIEEYSIFKNRSSANYINRIINMKQIEQIDLCGIAGDYCVLDTLKDGIKFYGKDMFNVLMPYVVSIDNGKTLNEFVKNNSIKVTY